MISADQHQTGLGLMEVLVASSVLATGIVCALSLQASALAVTAASAHRLQASLLVLELSERLHGEAHGQPPASQTLDLSSGELRQWAELAGSLLPQLEISIQPLARPDLNGWRLELQWSQGSLQTELLL